MPDSWAHVSSMGSASATAEIDSPSLTVSGCRRSTAAYIPGLCRIRTLPRCLGKGRTQCVPSRSPRAPPVEVPAEAAAPADTTPAAEVAAAETRSCPSNPAPRFRWPAARWAGGGYGWPCGERGHRGRELITSLLAATSARGRTGLPAVGLAESTGLLGQRLVAGRELGVRQHQVAARRSASRRVAMLSIGSSSPGMKCSSATSSRAAGCARF
jgi:hypothetical protein